MSEPFIGEIKMFGGNFAPRGYAFCNGQILPIAQNTALFSLLGTTYGGNGQTTFALPDLRGRVPIHPGQGPGLSNYSLGQVAGTENTTLLLNQMPAHNHILNSSSANANDGSPDNTFPAAVISPTQNNAAISAYRSTSDGTTMNPGVLSQAGGNQPFSNIQPYLCVTFVIALQGIFPSRN